MLVTTRSKLVREVRDEKVRQQNLEELRLLAIKKNWESIRAQGFGYTKDGLPPAILNYDKGRMLHQVMPEKAWKNQRCFIIGGGPSLKEFDFSKLKNEFTIGVNRAYEKFDCTINFAMDRDLYSWITHGKLGLGSQTKFHDFKGFPVWLDASMYNYPNGVFIVKKSATNRLSESIEAGIGGGTNSGYGAFCLAVALGANPIYLLGFDMKGDGEKQAWWHNGYPDKQNNKIYASFINDFKRVAEELRIKKIKVFNLNYDSDLKCFEFKDFSSIEKIKRPIITSFISRGGGYEEQVVYLKDSLRRFNLESDIEGIEDRGDWHSNVFYKPHFISKMLLKHAGRPIVFVDADAKIRNNPVLFNNLEEDFAVYFHHKNELLSGTLYFGNTEGSRFLIDEWIKEDERNPKTHMPQKNLRAVFDRIKDKISWKELPVGYCMIYDSRLRHRVDPVIEHFQLSRQYKGHNTQRQGHMRKKSLTEIQKFCKGKRICLIGNADSVLDKLDEKRNIDSFDIVCRMNRGDPRGKEKFIGSRTDIHFLSTSMSNHNIKKHFDPKFVIWMTICTRLAHPWVLRNAIQNPKEDWNSLYNELKINPTTGIMALKFLLNHIDFKALTIYGFDFFKTKTWYNTKIDSGQKHSGEKEEKLFMSMIKGKENVKFV